MAGFSLPSPIHAAQKKFEISEPKIQREIPKPDAQESNFERISPSSRDRTTSGFDAPARPPTPIPFNPLIAKKMEEYLDKRRNWIYNTPDKLDKGPSVAELFGFRDVKFDVSSNKRSKSAMERDFEEKSELKKEGPNNNRNKRADETGSDSNENSDSAREAGDLRENEEPNPLIPELSFNTFLYGDRLPDSMARAPGELGKNPFDPQNIANSRLQAKSEEKQKENERYDKDFQKLLQSRQQTSFLQSLDPINTQPDATRREVNPVIGRRTEEAAPAGINDLFERKGLSSALGQGPGIDAFGRMSAPVTVSPSFAPPASPLPAGAKPIILEIPRRRF